MSKKNNSSVGLALPARMDLAVNSLADMKIALLMFPFAKEVQDFCNGIQNVLRREKKIYPPYRQLNNGLLACSSTLTYGFEYLESIDYVRQYQAMAVGKSDQKLNIPTPEDIHELIFSWAKTWTEQYLNKKKGNKDEIESVCDRFLDKIENIPKDWQWQYIEPETLIEDINSNNGLGYQAIPSLLATLLHEKNITIELKDREQKITWRKVQGGGSSKTGLHLVSQPFQANYFDDNGKEKEGYFAYRLDFHLQTQAGRFNNEGHLKPWIFLHLSCQRYAHELLVDANHGRDISILMGMNTARIDNYPIDSTLVRLTVQNNDNKSWKEQLPELLTAFKARPLIESQEILNNPSEFGNLDNTNDWHKDEYYVIHVEGYKYKEEGKKGQGHNHHIKTGFSLKERAAIINQVLQLLDGVLIPDKPMECDIKAPTGKKLPLAMTDYEVLRKSLTPSALKNLTEEQKQEIFKAKQTIITDAIKRASNNKQIYLFVIYYEENTKILIHQQLRKAFLLEESDDFPEYLIIQDVHINNSELINKILVTDLSRKDRKKFDQEIKKGRQNKREDWREFLKNDVVNKVQNKSNSCIFAIIEIGKTQVKGIHPQQNIRGAVREACVLENINSQMLQTVKAKEKKHLQEETQYSKATEGRVLNAVLDITLRQTTTLYGLPSEVYQIAQIREEIAQNLDVIAFCRVQKNNFMGNSVFQYAIAVRLSATGKVDVLLPHEQEWIPYTQAGIAIGKLFHKARKKDQDSLEKVKMKGGDLAKFVADTLTNDLENPTIALIEADVWRNETSKNDKNNQAWFQLKNEYLLAQKDILDFNHVPSHCKYQRNDEKLNNLLAVIRLRSGKETPQYVTSRQTWDEDSETIDFTKLSGFIDKTVPELLHYFSIGRIPETQKKKQHRPKARELSKIEHQKDIYAANIAYKHQQMIEMLPFFIRADFQTEEKTKALCRVCHYLRTSPAHTKGNIQHPYPMHIGISLIEDMLCTLGLDV